MVLVVKNLPVNTGNLRNMGWIPGSRRFSRVGNGNPLQYSCLENTMDRGVLEATVHGVTESDMPACACTHTHTHTQLGKSIGTESLINYNLINILYI